MNESVIASKTEDENLKLKPLDVTNLIQKCYIHSHTKTCKKYSSECRFHFPKFPLWKTMLSKPLRFSKEENEEEIKLLKKKSNPGSISNKDLLQELLKLVK